MAVSAGVPRIRGRARPDLRSLASARVVVPLAFLLSAIYFAYQASHIESYTWLVDELLYVKNAVSYSMGDGPLPYVHGERFGVPNVLYPLLLAPLYGLLPSPDAFDVAHILNGLLWGSAGVPVYLLIRRFGAAWQWGLLGGLLTVWVPWSTATFVLMTESMAYATFPWALLAVTVAVADPRPRHDVLAILAIVLAASARTQLAFMLLVLLLAVAVHELSMRQARPWRARVALHWPLVALVVGGAVLVLLARALGIGLLGGYEVTAGLERFPPGLWSSAMQHFAHVIMGVGVVPAVFFFAWLISQATNPGRPIDRAFAAVAVTTLLVLLYQVAFFALTVAGVMQERYAIYAVPVLVVGGIALAADRQRRIAPLALLGGGLFCVAVTAGAPFQYEEATGAFERIQNGASGFNEVFEQQVPRLTGWLPGRDLTTTEGAMLLVLLVTVAAMVAFGSRLRRLAVPALLLCALVFTVAQVRYVQPRVILGNADSFPKARPGVNEQPRDWVDRAVDGDALVGLQSGRLEVPDIGQQWLWVEFWNDSITRAYSRDGGSQFSGFPAQKLDIDLASGRVRTEDVPDYLVVSPDDPNLRLEGEIVRETAYGAVLLKVDQPLQAAWSVGGAHVDGAPTEPERVLRIHAWPRAGEDTVKLRLTIRADSGPPETKFSYTVEGARPARESTLAAGERRTILVEGKPTGTGTEHLIRLTLPETRIGDKPATARLVAIERG